MFLRTIIAFSTHTPVRDRVACVLKSGGGLQVQENTCVLLAPGALSTVRCDITEGVGEHSVNTICFDGTLQKVGANREELASCCHREMGEENIRARVISKMSETAKIL